MSAQESEVLPVLDLGYYGQLEETHWELLKHVPTASRSVDSSWAINNHQKEITWGIKSGNGDLGRPIQTTYELIYGSTVKAVQAFRKHDIT